MNKPVRRSQAISPFGIGALVDFPGPVSLIHAGLDAWPFDEMNTSHFEFRIPDEKRLSRRLGVDYFVEPPDFRAPKRGEEAVMANLNLKLPFLRFPLWHSCPRCGRMWEAKLNEGAPPVCKGPIATGKDKGKEHSPRKTVQVRFVAACAKGHLQDFPWVEWLFKTPAPDWRPNNSKRWLRIRSTGSASLTGVEITAEELEQDGGIRIVKRTTLGQAFMGDATEESAGELAKVGIKCSGFNPVLAIGPNTSGVHDSCGEQLKPILRGASNLYFPIVESSIYIPEVADTTLDPDILDLLDDYQFKVLLQQGALNNETTGMVSVKAAKNALKKHYPELDIDPERLAEAANKHILHEILVSAARTYLDQKIKTTPDRSINKEIIKLAIQRVYPDWEIDPEALVEPISLWFKNETREAGFDREQQPDSVFSAREYRFQEYEVFCRDQHEGYPRLNLLIKSKSIYEYDDLVSTSFERISLLHKLRETRAFVGFSRLFPKDDLTSQERWSLISSAPRKWLPGIVVRGEGIFLKFREDKILNWLNSHGTYHEGRLLHINQSINRMREARHLGEVVVTPKQMLIHTFSHLLINELVYECGYGSASLRERLYCADGSNPMSGLLIYTAAGDSEGSMGGLVEMGKPGKLENVIAKALERASWCSSDPLCIESSGQGPDNCNLAACHSCALIPETSCEEQNRLLDRGVVLGTILNSKSGFFF